MDLEEFLKGRIRIYSKYIGDEANNIPGLWQNEGNIRMAKKIIWEYNRELKKLRRC